jgi:hypothetical protein
MAARVSLADAHEVDDSPSCTAALPIVNRIRRPAPRVDISAILWPLERAARTRLGRSAGKVLLTSTLVVVLAVFAIFNVRGDPDGEHVPGVIAHEATLSVHERREIAGFHPLLVVLPLPAVATPALPSSLSPPASPSPPPHPVRVGEAARPLVRGVASHQIPAGALSRR